MKFVTFDRLTLFGRRWFFTIVGSNGEPLAQSEAYNDPAPRDWAINLIKRDAATAKRVPRK